MSDNQRFRNQAPQNILNGTNLRLSAPTPDVPKAWSNLSFRAVNGNARILIYTNDPNDKTNNGIIQVKMTPIVWANFARLLRMAAQAKPGERYTMECEDYTWDGGQRSEKPELLHRIIIGKDQDGVVSLMVLDVRYDRRPKIKFEFRAPRFVNILGTDGAPMDRADSSAYQALCWADMLDAMVTPLMVSNWQPPKPRNNQGGGGGYNRGGGNQGGGGYQRNNDGGGNSGGGGSDFEDDLPF